MKVLYVSSMHPSLEKNDLGCLTALGIEWFSTGVYLDPKNPHSTCMKGPIDLEPDLELIDKWKLLNPDYNVPRSPQTISKSFADKFDVIIVNNFVRNLQSNWDSIKHKQVIFRSYDGHTPSNESYLKFLKSISNLMVVRLFEFETRVPYACSSDIVIPNYVECKDYLPWVGEELYMLTFNNDFLPRLHARDRFGKLIYPGMGVYLDLIKKHSYKLFGMGNPSDISKGFLSAEEQKEEYRKNRVYFSIGSKPGPYTYSWLESLAAGIPSISFGKGLGDFDVPEYSGSYEVPNLIENGVNGFYSDRPEELDSFISELFKNYSLAKEISNGAKALAERRFSKKIALEKWETLFKQLIF